MKILYGVVGEGMGHATRSRVVIEHLLRTGNEVRVVVSGKAHRFLVERLSRYPNVKIDEINGLTLSYFGNKLDKSTSLYENLKNSPKSIKKNIEVYRQVAEEGFEPELVFSDFESWAALYALRHRLPVISIDNMQIIARCRHRKSVRGKKSSAFRWAEAAVKVKMPGAYHYLISSFFFPEVEKKRTTLVPPVLREEILAARREPGDHVLVYQRAMNPDEIVPVLKTLPYRFRVYGVDREGSEGNVTLCPFSETRFVDDLRTARAVIAGGGFSLMSEAVTLHVPLLAIPSEEQYEQELNARYLEHLGFGSWTTKLERDTILEFLGATDDYSQNLERYPRYDNSILFACVDELLALRGAGATRPKVLETATPGKWEE
jgi:uncharacterized protein (TIGR00661 family)